MEMNLRADETFVEDEGWHRAAQNYSDFLKEHLDDSVLFLELGVGYNTPGIIKYPFWQKTYDSPKNVYACVNMDPTYIPPGIDERSVSVRADLKAIIDALQKLHSESSGS
ncbi:MAG: hypothetical protein LUB61_07990 [Eggerthellaceae bacterium]|nr:hypothetical protein [Eggerthellaceae bacterium]